MKHPLGSQALGVTALESVAKWLELLAPGYAPCVLAR